ncbi:MAG: 1,4-alpha-glucan branching protein GlgB [Oscillospiraceae bacterium]|nr:1,4-alpha-glucan branching protein GlgB [Oscillospiraceae bacterium]
MNRDVFYNGQSYDSYNYLGCHLDDNGATFRVYAPMAQNIALIGDFNGWDETPMTRDGSFWECRVENAQEGHKYKYRIYGANDYTYDHCDPYGFGMELRPGSCSVIRRLDGYKFTDTRWMNKRCDCKDKPLNIYEVHLGSWKTNPDADPDNVFGWYNYAEIAQKLVPYVKEKGYNYIELMPIAEHPSDNSWGYQTTGFFAPTARYGTPDQLKEFINTCHKNNIGVILDFVPVHFAIDGYGLAFFDGTHLFEYPHDDVGYSEWGSKNFNHSRGEVQSFLKSCANYWLKEFHFDGLRIDALRNIVFWHGNQERGENLNAIDFIRQMNKGLKEMYPDVMLIAEDSSDYPGITHPADEGGMGFDYKWDMGWMHDTLDYFRLHPYDRKAAYHKLTFSMWYFPNERYLMPLSHDEVVHGKATILQQMNGDYEHKFPQARALYMYMYAHPGKKLNFMGGEFGQLREWDEKREQDWLLLDYPNHVQFAQYMQDLNNLYLKKPALYQDDFKMDEGFKWIDCHQEDKRIYVFERACEGQRIVAIFNLSETHQQYRLKVDNCTQLKLLMATDEEKYGGWKNYENEQTIKMTADGVDIVINGATGILYQVREPIKRKPKTETAVASTEKTAEEKPKRGRRKKAE